MNDHFRTPRDPSLEGGGRAFRMRNDECGVRNESVRSTDHSTLEGSLKGAVSASLDDQNRAPKRMVDRIAEAVLYEGYILYPYRPSTAKNRQRFTFGRVYPKAYSDDQRGAEPYLMQTQCLLEAADAPLLSITVRFLHPTARDVGRLTAPWEENEEPEYDVVPTLQVGETLYQTWQESVERTMALPPLAVHDLVKFPHEQAFSFEDSRSIEALRDGAGPAEGVLVRRQAPLDGVVEVSAEEVASKVFRITVRIRNLSGVPLKHMRDQEAILLRTFASAHTILEAEGGAFFSSMDPPENVAHFPCENVGTWPVLVGEKGAREVMLSSPIILYDYPEIAPESPGDLHDGLEIDEILTLRIMTMTDREKAEMRDVDERARRILQRTETLAGGDLMALHGTIRGLRPLGEDDA